MAYKRACITVDTELWDLVAAQMDQTGDSASAIVRMALRRYYMVGDHNDNAVMEMQRRFGEVVLRNVREGLANALEEAQELARIAG
jgi:negative regulator of replication initiation